MHDDRWDRLLSDIRGGDINAVVDASICLYNEAEKSDVPRLLALLVDDDFVVREAAAWPLASVGGPDVLPQLFAAYQRGFDEGHDNDGFTTALIELVELDPDHSRQKLMELLQSDDAGIKSSANWLLEFC